MARAQSNVLTDREEIRRWAEERGATPACVRGTGGDVDIGMLRLDFPGYSGEQSLEHIEWDEWFDKFDERNLALIVQEETASGERSNFNKLIGRETAQQRARGSSKASRRHPERGRVSARVGSGKTSAGRTGTRTGKGRSAKRSASSRKSAGTRAQATRRRGASGVSGGRTSKKQRSVKTANTRASAGNKSAQKTTRGSTRARRTESARGRTESRRRAA